jgi:hypothetical protein
MPNLDLPDGAVVVVPYLGRAWVAIVQNDDEHGAFIMATNPEDLFDEAAAFLRSFGSTDLKGGRIRECPPKLAAKAVFPDAISRPV